jgi:hypothetical protein
MSLEQSLHRQLEAPQIPQSVRLDSLTGRLRWLNYDWLLVDHMQALAKEGRPLTEASESRIRTNISYAWYDADGYMLSVREKLSLIK